MASPHPPHTHPSTADHARVLHFDPSTPRWAATGALTGAASVVVATVAAILVAELRMDLLGVAALGAFFGGAGMGGMLGAVLAEVRTPVTTGDGRS